jgi:hypothetical protein
LIQDWSESVVFHHLADGGAIIEVLDNVIDIFRETVV